MGCADRQCAGKAQIKRYFVVAQRPGAQRRETKSINLRLISIVKAPNMVCCFKSKICADVRVMFSAVRRALGLVP